MNRQNDLHASMSDIEQVYIEEKQFILLCIPRRLRVTQGRY